MSITKQFKVRAKVAFTDRKGTRLEGRVAEYSTSGRGEWVTVDIGKGKTYKLRPSQLQAA